MLTSDTAFLKNEVASMKVKYCIDDVARPTLLLPKTIILSLDPFWKIREGSYIFSNFFVYR